MAYSKELIREVHELYPEAEAMHKLAKEGSVWLGRYLDDSAMGSVPLDTILSATSLAEVQAMARIIKRKKALYAKWCDEDPRKEEKSL